MAARFNWFECDSAGNGTAGLTLTLHRYSDDTNLGTFTDAGTGNYYIEHSISEKVLIKKSGVTIAVTSGMMFPADDVALATNLISTASGKGASLIGVQDSGGRLSGATVEAILTELPTLAELASTAANYGASLIGLQDSGGYYAADDLEAALAEIGAIIALLSGLTSTAAELNKLDGASANVTATNLNLLTAGGETTLHTHDMNDLAGNVLVGAHQTDMDVYVQSQYSSSYGKGDVILDVYYVDGSGKVYVRKPDDSEVATLYEIMTAYEVGNLNFSGDPILGNIAAPGKVTQALLRLAQQVMGTAVETGLNFMFIDSGYTTAGGSAGNEATDLDVEIWSETSATEKVKRKRPFVQLPGVRYAKLKGNATMAAGYSGTVQMHVDTESDSATITASSFEEFSLVVDLSALGEVTVPTIREYSIGLTGDGTHTIKMNSQYIVWGEM